MFEIIAELNRRSAHVDALERHRDHMESVNTNEKEDKTTRPQPRT